MGHTLFRRALPAIALLLALAPLGAATANPLAERLRVRLESGETTQQALTAGEAVLAIRSLQRFYLQRGFEPAWSVGGQPSAALSELLVAIGQAERHGLAPADYHRDALLRLSATAIDAGQAVDLDLLATDAYLLLAAHYLGGRIDPEQLDPEWRADRRELDLVAHLQQTLGDGDIGGSLAALLPQQPGYRKLEQQLADYRERADWPRVSAGPKLQPGDVGPRVAELRHRLAAEGLAPDSGTGELFDPALADAVKQFQRRHGLEADGIVGDGTLAQLNVTRAERVAQILVNLERWRWLPNDLGAWHLRINIADYRLEAWQDGAKAIDMKVIVGKAYRRTPVFSERMRYLVLNPRWVVPPRIAVQDKLPQFRSDPKSLTAKGFDVYRGWGADEKPVDPATIDWQSLSGKNFPYRLVQRPGPQNALGQIKFMFPNKFDVYLHDTPDRHLFERNDRNFSSGCIRLHRPLDLAEWVLRETPGWSRAAIEQALAAGQEQTVRLRTPLPVHLQYWTAWVDDAGELQLRRDPYGRDRALAAALGRSHP